jgi:hypothetical protein
MMLLNTNKNLAVYRKKARFVSNLDEIVAYMPYQIVEEILREERPQLFDNHKFVSILHICEDHYVNPFGDLRRWYEICVSYHFSKQLCATAGGYENIEDLDIKVRDKKLKKIIDESNLST